MFEIWTFTGWPDDGVASDFGTPVTPPEQRRRETELILTDIMTALREPDDDEPKEDGHDRPDVEGL